MVLTKWTEERALMLIWTCFYSLAFYVFRNHKKFEDRKKKKDRVAPIHFRNLASPPSLPVVGHLWQLGRQPHLVLTKLARLYGPLMRIRLGFQEVLVVTGLDAIKNALEKESVTFAGRPNLETSKLVFQGLSLTFSDYSPAWEQQHNSAAAALSLYTTGKDHTKRTAMELSTAKHANTLVDQLIAKAQLQDRIVNPRDYVLSNVTNSVCSICFGQDFDINDPRLKELLQINRSFDAAMGAAQPANFWPVLRHFPILARSFRNLKIYMDRFWAFVSTLLDSHWQTYNENNMRDIADCLYHESEKGRRNNNKTIGIKDVCSNGGVIAQDAINISGGITNVKEQEDHYSSNKLPFFQTDSSISEVELRQRIIYSVGDIFGAGFDTIFTTVHWSLLYLAVYPHAQRKIFDETSRMMSPEEPSSFKLHGSKCTYAMAWIYELLRHVTHVPLLIPHSTTKDTVLNNCSIPKGTTVYFNTWQASKDPDLWENPDNFRPERFLVEKDGFTSLKQNAVSKLLVWGAGKRKCLGHQLSKHQLFIFITTIVRRMVISQAQAGIEPALPWPSTLGLTRKPKVFNIQVLKR